MPDHAAGRPGGPSRRPTVSFDQSSEVANPSSPLWWSSEAGTFEVIERCATWWPRPRDSLTSRAVLVPRVPRQPSTRSDRLKTRPDVVLCDGQGIAHPRRLGIASHLGLWLRPADRQLRQEPRFAAEYDEPGPTEGDRSPLIDKGEVVGAVLQDPRFAGSPPLFVSPGHRCDLESAVGLVLATTRKLRLPIPARMAHEYVNEIRRAAKSCEKSPP